MENTEEGYINFIPEGFEKTKNVSWFFFKGLGDLRADNQRLKDENAALIRVISKLSRWKKKTNKKLN